jgi:NAD(P)-dependent dehydrogenase (short-subunit alcohol dehydrogenase family)
MVGDGIRGTTVILTGAAGGIGRAVAPLLREAGADVVAADLSAAGLEELAGEIPGIRTVVADVGTGEGASACVAAADGRVGALINNAGVSDGLAAVDELDDATWEHVLRVNLTSAYLLTSRVIGGMLEAGHGSIVNVASIAGIRGGRGGAAYTASKYGLVGLTQNVAATHGGEGIRCNAVCPGSTTGTVSLRSVPLTSRAEQRRTRDRDRPEAAPPETVASVIVWLLSGEARRLNGAIIPIDDGWTAY